MSDSNACTLEFNAGTLIIHGPEKALDLIIHEIRADKRIGAFRAPGNAYSSIMRTLYRAGIPVKDHARNYVQIPDLQLHSSLIPMKHQALAMKAWREARGQGVVVMPTGSGKTFFAALAMNLVKRSTLVVVPTIDLLQQWAGTLEKLFQRPVGMLGGGSRNILDLTVSTYDSAALQMEFIGNRFGLVVFDECHHLPGPVNRIAASMCIAPYRLGLTATPEREDGGETALRDLVGETVYCAHIDELEGTVLAPYVTRRITVELSEQELAEYTAARGKYIAFVRAAGLHFEEKGAWNQFIALCARKPGGREVMAAYRRQRTIARCSHAKLDVLWRIIRENPGARILVFTADNDTAYQIGETLCLPVLTHKTKAAERKFFLEQFRAGAYPVLVTSKVLNEGVDVPEASIGIVVSGSGSTREHVQRLGRILRKSGSGKQAVLYELVSAGTSEMGVSERRRNHRAYQPWAFRRKNQLQGFFGKDGKGSC